MSRPTPLHERVHDRGHRLGAVRERIVAGAASALERAQTLRALRAAEQECHTLAQQVAQALALIVAAGGDDAPTGGGRAA